MNNHNQQAEEVAGSSELSDHDTEHEEVTMLAEPKLKWRGALGTSLRDSSKLQQDTQGSLHPLQIKRRDISDVIRARKAKSALIM
jgi:hypothetical protein